jgi:hypothetical protein
MNIKELAQKYEHAKGRLERHSRSSLQITHTARECEVIADGCRRIVSCDSNLVVFEQMHKRVTVAGAALKLRNWGSDGVTVSGAVQSVEFSERIGGEAEARTS